ncbi:hypothetical protein LDENG_00254690 [Lucifuga dentata]|nr:hypothetical protein LDENG_00254690 [Lucifuga dentata]
MRADQSSLQAAQPSTSQAAELSTRGRYLWQHLDNMVIQSRSVQNMTADATVEVQRYLTEPNIGRQEDPIK